MGQIGPILDIFFICMKIRGKIVSLTKTDVIKITTHQGSPTIELICSILSLTVWINGLSGWNIHGISDRYLASKSMNLN